MRRLRHRGLRRGDPDVAVHTAAIGREFNDHGDILPGLGNAVDRVFGTKQAVR